MIARKTHVVFCLLFVCSLVYLTLTLVRQPLEVSDFRYIWTAGDVWAHHGNPYSKDYPAAGLRQFATGLYPVRSWVYPFHWYFPARFAASFEPSRAFAIWTIFSVAIMALAGWCSWTAAASLNSRWSLAALIGLIGIVCSSTPLTFLLRHGQPATLALVGISVLVLGVATHRPYVTALGVALAMLKPHLGAPIVLALMFMPRGFYSAFVGGLLTVLLSLPAFVASGFWPQFFGILRESAGNYQRVTYNMVGAMSGLPHGVFFATGKEISISQSTVIAAVLAVASVLLTKSVSEKRHVALFIGFNCSITAAIVSLHGYDLTILFIALPLLPLFGKTEALISVIGYALLWRSENLARVLGGLQYTPSVQSIAAALIVIAWLLTARAWIRQKSDVFTTNGSYDTLVGNTL